VTDSTAEWLLIRYRTPEGVSPRIGIALYIPRTDELYLQFRDDMTFVDADDLEVLAESSLMFRNMAVEMGAKATFEWMSSTLSNVLFVEGPHSVVTRCPNDTLTELFQEHCGT
jgi:hypothetical protein